ncbi:DUF3179 domain-containing protein [Edaphobacter bradus]|uniref:DUF3179 domain-containing protein n=1 Tax=Edaphobacter bradus TaxID=2259016 RepID=UPI0021DFF798|nr:DUF3179 domain-containing protein [Edaphobacter bradus]
MAQVLEEQRVGTRTWLWLALGLGCALVSAACVWIPMHVIRPFRPQDPTALTVALWFHDAGPWISGLCVAWLVAVTIWSWKRVAGGLRRLWFRIAMISLCMIAIAGACLTHVNIFEKMFHPYDAPAFGSADTVPVAPDDRVLAVRLGEHARAYPILTMGYHHIVNDTVGGVPITVTYCTLCHTGLVWDPVVDGKRLHFRLAGINNGNALMRDEETHSVWQQSTGEAIFGPLKGRHLNLIHSSELTFALWRKEQPQGDVLKPDAPYVPEYEKKGWESYVEKTPAMVDTKKSGIGPHQLMLGVTVAGKNKAYPIDSILAAKLIQDQVADSPVVVVVGSDGASIRVFEAAELTFARGEGDRVMQDAETGSGWNFQGCAVDGKLAGRCLKEIDANKDYWFDWMNHHPETAVFRG